jgi:hypothetical protein
MRVRVEREPRCGKDGTFPAFVSDTWPQDDDGLVGTIRACADITMLKKAEDRIQAEQKYERWWSSPAVSSLSNSPPSRTLYISPS